MENKSISFVAALAVVSVMASGFTVFATETETVEDIDVTKSISTEIIESETNETASLDIGVIDIPVLALAVATDTDAQMVAQVILGDSSDPSSAPKTVKEGGDYTFLVSGLDVGKHDFTNFVLTFDFNESPIKGSDIEDLSIDITELKIGEVSFNVEGATFDKSKYDGGFRLFDIINADKEAYTKAFSEDGDSSGIEARVNSFSVSIHITTLKLEKEEPPVTTTVTTTTSTTTTTTVTTESPTTNKPADPVTQPATTAASNTTKATTTAKPATTTVTTKKPNNETTPPPTGDAGVGVAVALLATSASIATAARKRNK